MNESAENVTTPPSLVPAEPTLTWYDITTLEPGVFWMYCFAFVCNILVGLPTNVWVLWLIVRGPKGTLASEVLTLNLAVLELIFCLNVPLGLLHCFVVSSVISKSFSFFVGLILFGRPLFQCCICLERYLAVLHPLIFLKYRPLRYKASCSAVVWMITLGGCSVITFTKGLVLICVTVVVMILLLSVKSFCCLAILRALRYPGPGEGPHLAKKKAFRIITVSLVLTLVNYLPMIAVGILKGLGCKKIFIAGYAVCFSVSVFCTFVHPLLFLSRAGKLQCIMGIGRCLKNTPPPIGLTN